MLTLEDDFQYGMSQVYEVAKDHGYVASQFKQMLDQYKGVETAKRLLATREIQYGFTKLWELNLLPHTVEALVIQKRFQPLFTPEEIEEARRRLEELGYFK